MYATCIAVFCSYHVPGLVVDMEVFYSMMDIQKKALLKRFDEVTLTNVGPMYDDNEDY